MHVPSGLSEIESSNSALLQRILSISRAIKWLMSNKLAEIGLHIGQGDLLTSVLEGEKIAVFESAERLNIRPSSASKLIDHLVQRDLIRRFVDPLDSRKTLIEITPSGVIVQEKILKIKLDVEYEVFKIVPLPEMINISDTIFLINNITLSLLQKVRK